MRFMVASLAAWTLATAGCADEVGPAPDRSPALELRMQAAVPANAEVEYCQFVTVPETWITRDAVELTLGAHHVAVFQTPYASIPTRKLDGTEVDTSGVFDCSEGASSSWAVTKGIGGSQSQDGESFLSFPEGVGMRIGGVLLMSIHYINGSDAPLDTDVRFRFATAPADQIVHEGDVLVLSHPLISVPPGSTVRTRQRCPVYEDIEISNAQVHMHARGFGFEARVDGDAPFYTSDRWEDVPVEHYQDFTVKAGSVIDFHCDYRNTEGRPIYMGPRATDEMCVLVGSYYPADPRISSCLDQTGTGFGGEWIGQGAATCQQTMDCLNHVQDLPGISDCMLAASPGVSRESSELVRCFLRRAQDPSTDCGPQIQACAAR